VLINKKEKQFTCNNAPATAVNATVASPMSAGTTTPEKARRKERKKERKKKKECVQRKFQKIEDRFCYTELRRIDCDEKLRFQSGHETNGADCHQQTYKPKIIKSINE
jgi:hypothetical protein